ncbi:threonine aldolase [Streptococcus acidominimus]|uniref:Threonine aldolase n=1 Tax=Streptococcus acidominimus TaxID=1326 RepID=A0A239WHI4_STRAI|nr:aminotransferase class V-fold PLP-dependent enzyme [Streptococcus acidominimus]SNV33882.1 threonine aldolase [Streptococcus acidominimus]
MLHFENDYHKGVHPDLLQVILETNDISQSGYGMDEYTARATAKIQQAIACPDAQIQFLAGGTQTNQLAIDSLLKSYEGIISAETGHIATHEAGAIEFVGHKVITLPHHEGKLIPRDVADYLEAFYEDETREHRVFPGMVYVTHPTEYGTLYTKSELTELAEICRQYEIPLFLDGARLGYGLAAKDTDVTLKDIAELCDVFYIGGTKLGALIGEALIYTKHNMPKHFSAIVKQRGALLAKGRFIGLQFDKFFTDDLYLKIGEHALGFTEQLKTILKEKGYRFYLESPTNQQFIIVENKKLQELQEKVVISVWEKYDDQHTVVRFATSWSTSQEDIDALKEIL